MQSSTNLKTYTKLERNMYLTGLFGQNIIFNVAAAFTGYYMQSVLFIPVAITGVVLVIAQVWDAFNDPMMGTIVDRTRSKWGKCRPYLIFVPLINAVITMMCFLSPAYDNGVGASTMHNIMVVLWAGGFYILWGMSYTAGDIPLWGISALMTEDEKHRQKLQANARLFAGVGSAIALVGFQPAALAMASVLENETRGPEEAARLGFILMAAIFVVIGAGTFQMAGLFTREKIAPSVKMNKVGENFKMMWQNKPFRQLLVSGTLGAPRNLIMIIALNLVTYYFAGKDGGKAMVYLVLLGGGLFGGMLGATALVPKLLERMTKQKLYLGANLFGAIPQLATFVLYLVSLKVENGLASPVMLVLASLLFAVQGVCLGLLSTVQTAMIADTVDYEDYTNHIRPDAVFFSGQTFIVKIGNGISQILYAGLCGLVMFSGKNVQLLQGLMDTGALPRDVMKLGSDAVVYTSEMGILTADRVFWFITMMFFAVSVLPAIGSVLSALPMFKYALSPDKYEEVLTTLQARRRENGEIEEAPALAQD